MYKGSAKVMLRLEVIPVQEAERMLWMLLAPQLL